MINQKINSYNSEIKIIAKNNYSVQQNTISDLALPERIIRLLFWNDKKKELKFNTNRPQFAPCIKYGVYFAYLGTNIGSEINKLRPVLIWRKHESSTNPMNNSYFVFPLSSKIPARDYFYNVKINVNGNENVIHIHDGRRISGLRILKPLIDNRTMRMYTLKTIDQKKVKKAIKEYFNIVY